jgi:hypothetical protein
MIHYSRDEQSGALRKVHNMLSCIRDGTFQPDANRSGRIVKVARVEESFLRPTPKTKARQAEVEETASSESSESSSCRGIPVGFKFSLTLRRRAKKS